MTWWAVLPAVGKQRQRECAGHGVVWRSAAWIQGGVGVVFESRGLVRMALRVTEGEYELGVHGWKWGVEWELREKG